MLGKYITKENVRIMADKTRVQDVYSYFLNNGKFIVIVDAKDKPTGIIHKEDIISALPSSILLEHVKMCPVTVVKNTAVKEVDKILFHKAKEKVDEIIVMDPFGGGGRRCMGQGRFGLFGFLSKICVY